MILTYPIYIEGLFYFSLKVWDYQSQSYVVKRYWSYQSYEQALKKYNEVMNSKLVYVKNKAA